MSERARPLHIGAFLLGGLALLVAAVFLISGGHWLERQDRVLMHFRGSTFGLQVGAPVVFRGVRVGTVRSIDLQYDAGPQDYAIAVGADLDHDALLRLRGPQSSADAAPAILDTLVQRGLTAQLGMQSLLTGQLYIDLDLRPHVTALRLNLGGREPEIPTSPTAIQALKSQLEGLDVKKLVDDVASIAASAKSLVERPQLVETLDNVARISADIRQVTQHLDQRIALLTGSTQRTLQATRQSMDRAALAADRIASAAGRVDALLAPDSAVMRSARTSLDELAATLAALRQQADGDSELMRHADQAIQDVSRAATAVRDLSEMLERQPQALIRGRAPLSPSPSPGQ